MQVYGELTADPWEKDVDRLELGSRVSNCRTADAAVNLHAAAIHKLQVSRERKYQ